MKLRDRRRAAGPIGRRATEGIARGAPVVALLAVLALAGAIRSLAQPAVTTAAPTMVLVVDAVTDVAATVSWTSVDGATTYRLVRDGDPIAEGPALRYRDAALTPGSTHEWQVAALAGDAELAISDPVSATLEQAADVTPPTAPSDLVASEVTDRSAALAWVASSDDVRVITYLVSVDGDAATPIEAPAVTVGGLAGGTTHVVEVRAIDAAGNASAPATVELTTLPSTDVTLPKTPDGLRLVDLGADGIDVWWHASSDAEGAPRYLVYRDGSPDPIATLRRTEFLDTGASKRALHSYQVAAIDAAGNTSPLSAPVEIMTASGGDPVITRGPTVQWAGAATAHVEWTTDVPGPSTVAWTRVGGSATTSVDPTEVTHHSVLVGPLEPGADYDYEVTTSATTATGSFRAAPGSGDPFHFLAVGDFGARSSAAEAVAARIEATPSDALIALGDDVYPTGARDDQVSALFDPYRVTLQDRVFMAVLGNHDHYSPGGPALLDELGLPGNERWYAFDAGPAHVTVLSSTEPYAPGTPQYAFLQADLAAHQDASWRIVLLHHPTYSSDRGPGRLRRDLAPLFEHYDVDLVLNGHAHGYERTQPIDGVTYVTSGGGGVGLAPTWPSASWSAVHAAEYEFLDVTVTQEALSVTAVRPDGTALDTVTLTPDTTPPSIPGTPSASVVSPTRVRLSWLPATDDALVVGYRLARDGVPVGSLLPATAKTYLDTGLEAGTSPGYSLTAIDSAGNETTVALAPVTLPTTWWVSAGGDATVSAGDPAATGGDGPSLASSASPETSSYLRFDLGSLDGAPIAAAALQVGGDDTGGTVSIGTASPDWAEAALTWDSRPSTDRVLGTLVVPVVDRVLLAPIGVPDVGADGWAGLSLTGGDDGVAVESRETGHGPRLWVSLAVDESPPGTVAKPALTVLSPGTVRLSWSGVTDDVLVAGYQVERNGVEQPAILPATVRTLTDATLGPGATVAYRVRAIDAAGNAGAWSAVASRTIPLRWSFVAVADATIGESSPDAADGRAPRLRVDGAPVSVGLLRFDIATVLGWPVASVELSLERTEAGASPLRVSPVFGRWAEATVTWAHRPAIGEALPSVTSTFAGGRLRLQLPIDSLGRDLALTSLDADGGSFASRESADPPVLTVTLAPGP